MKQSLSVHGASCHYSVWALSGCMLQTQSSRHSETFTIPLKINQGALRTIMLELLLINI